MVKKIIRKIKRIVKNKILFKVDQIIKNMQMQKKTIPLDKILRGSEGDELTGLQYVLMTGEKFRTSTRVIDGPQVKLLQEFRNLGKDLFDSSCFEKTCYYKNALECIHYLGGYYPSAMTPEKVVNIARRYIDSYLEKDISQYESVGHNKFDELIVVRPIYNSDCYQLVSGNHRVASAFMRGKRSIDARVITKEPTRTYFTDLISKVVWDEGKELYQPIELPELTNIPLIRKSEDRLEKMINFINNHGIDFKNKTVLDVGSYYGWFVKKFHDRGSISYGLERDFSACLVAEELHSLSPSQFINKPLEVFIKNDNSTYDIILFLSVLHHFILGKSYMDASYVLKKLSEKTKHIMFFETGEEHEKMFGNALNGWNEESIKNFILENSDFKQVISLGRDKDNIGKYENDYSRMLFALIK